MTSWLDIHMILIYALLALALWSGIKCLTSGQSRSSFVILGLALGGAGVLYFLRKYNDKLIKQADQIQIGRDELNEDIAQKKKELVKLKKQDAVEQEKLNIQIETREKTQQEMEQTGRNLQETINDLKNKYSL